MAITYGQDVIPAIERREIISAEDEQFTKENYHLRMIEFKLLGVEQIEENRLHFRMFEEQLRTAVRDLKAVLQVARASKVHPKIRKEVLLNAHKLLWDAQHRYLPNDEHFICNGSEEVTSLLIFSKDRILTHLQKYAPEAVRSELGRHDMSHRYMFPLPRVTEPFTRRQPEAYGASRPKRLEVSVPLELENVSDISLDIAE